MPIHDIMQAAKEFAADLKTATGFIGSITTFVLTVKSMVRMFGRGKKLRFLISG